jgi:hypothetical protein
MIVKTLASVVAARFLTGLAITNLLFDDLIKAVSAKAKNDKNTVLIVSVKFKNLDYKALEPSYILRKINGTVGRTGHC